MFGRGGDRGGERGSESEGDWGKMSLEDAIRYNFGYDVERMTAIINNEEGTTLAETVNLLRTLYKLLQYDYFKSLTITSKLSLPWIINKLELRIFLSNKKEKE